LHKNPEVSGKEQTSKESFLFRKTSPWWNPEIGGAGIAPFTNLKKGKQSCSDVS
jgi:hypothetical protein